MFLCAYVCTMILSRDNVCTSFPIRRDKDHSSRSSDPLLLAPAFQPRPHRHLARTYHAHWLRIPGLHCLLLPCWHAYGSYRFFAGDLLLMEHFPAVAGSWHGKGM